MVLKPLFFIIGKMSGFESDVISDGTQTSRTPRKHPYKFESDVISDGTQTRNVCILCLLPFESDVISDGTQTNER